jgi:hypothetical protein
MPARTHGHCRDFKYSPEYSAWNHMIQRCTNRDCKAWGAYGGRGISVCEQWRTFENFLADVGGRPSRAYSLDRINNDGNYEPGNVRWALKLTQARNTRTNKFITFDSVTKCLAEWADQYGVNRETLRGRLSKGVPFAVAVSKESFAVRGPNGQFKGFCQDELEAAAITRNDMPSGG